MNDEQDREQTAKLVLFLSCIIIGGIVGFLFYHFLFQSLICILIAILVALLNPSVAALSTRISELLHRVSFPDTYEKWSVPNRAWQATFWPITLFFWIVISIFYLSINRLFK